ncbi:MAG: alpha/beta hydrolase [Gemmatimonadetes bacterium]|nr:alpha/beta hydrolase [Gemmatimonadota bacterium]
MVTPANGMDAPSPRRVVIEGAGHPAVSGLLTEAASASCLLVLGHGAGAPMTHPFMEALAAALQQEGMSTLRYNFAYMEAGRRRPDHLRRLLAVVASALVSGRECAGGVPVFAGGKSMGGRMTSTLVADHLDAGPGGTETVSGLVLFGFPLHAPGRRESVRGEHLARVPCPMLFHQGTRDRLADLELLRPLLQNVGPRATLHVVEGGDHSLGMLKRSGRTQDDVLAEVAGVTRRWVDGVLSQRAKRA